MGMEMTTERTIPRPADEVFEYFADASNNPAWQKGMQSCEWITEPPIGVGSQYRQLARLAGRDIISVFGVTEYDPGHLIRIETIESTFPIQVTRIVEPIDDHSCVVRASITGGPCSLAAQCAGTATGSTLDRRRLRPPPISAWSLILSERP
jgi:uncharacterized protein YndB with AHSA1/START domain